MSLTLVRGTHLLLEGPSDSRFWKAHVTVNECHIVICDGKQTALISSAMLEAAGVSAVLAIVDDDLDSLVGRPVVASNVVVTDFHDLEATIFASLALERVLAEYSDTALVSAFVGATGATIRDLLVDRALPFGRLRYVNEVNKLGVSFHALSPYRYIDRTTWALDINRLLTDFATAAGKALGDVQQLYAAAPAQPSWGLIHGHDAEAILHIALSGVLSQFSPGRAVLSSALRIAFDKALLKATNMWASIKAWEAAVGLVAVAE